MDKIICNKVVAKEIATELGLSLSIVETIVSCQSEYVAQVMSSGTFDSIRLPYLGCFKSKPKEIQMINHLKGMTKEQAEQFKKDVRTRRIILNHWEKKK